MKAAWYAEKGDAESVLKYGDHPDIEPDDNEVQIEIHYSGINPGDIAKRVYSGNGTMPYPEVIPHSDGSGVIRKAGKLIPADWIGRKVLCFGAQSYRPYGTAAEYCCVPLDHVIVLSDDTPMVQAAQMGIPAVTGHRAIHVLKNIYGKTILVHGGAGAVGQCAIHFGKRAGARMIATVTREEDVAIAREAGADDVFILQSRIIALVREKYPEGIDHIVEVSFARNILMDLELLKNGGSVAAYSGNADLPELPFWQLIFENISLYFLGSDDFAIEDKRAALDEAVMALDSGWKGFAVGRYFKLSEIVEAHQYVEFRSSAQRAVINIKK